MDRALQDFIERLMDAEADEKKLPMLMGLVEECFDCKQEINELKTKIKELKERNAKFQIVARRERLLIQKRANYINMLGRLCKELRKPEEKVNPADYMDDLEDYE